MCPNDYEYSKSIAETILSKIAYSTEENANWPEILFAYLDINDEYKIQRVEWIFGTLYAKSDNGSYAIKCFYKKLSDDFFGFYTWLPYKTSFSETLFRNTSITY